MFLLALTLLQSQAPASPVCLAKSVDRSMGDRIVAVVAGADLAAIRRKGFAVGDCRQLVAEPVRFARETCGLARKASPEQQAMTEDIFGVSPSTLCSGAQLLQSSR